MKAQTGLTSLVPSGSILAAGADPATRPFVRLGESAIPERIEASGTERGGLVTFPVHAFAGPKEASGIQSHTAERHAAMIGHEIGKALHRARETIDSNTSVRFRLSDVRLLADGDTDLWHWTALVNCRVLAA